MGDIEDLDLEFSDPPDSTEVIEALWHEAAEARRYGDGDAAIAAYRRLLALDPHHTEARLAAAETCRVSGRPMEGLRFCLQLLEMDPQHLGCRLELAEALRQIGQPEESRSVIDILLLQRPDSVQVWCGLARLLADENKLAGAEATLGRALRLDPGHAASWSELGLAKARRGDWEGAVDSLHGAIALAPQNPAHRVRLAEILLDMGRTEEAAESLDRALALDEEDAAAHVTRGGLKLLEGRLTEAWEDFHWRHQLPGAAHPVYPAQTWDGESLDGRHLLLVSDSSPCDTLLLLRFLPVLAGRSAGVTLWLDRQLLPLAGTLPGVTRALPRDEPLPEGFSADFAVELADVPRLLQVGLSTLPAPLALAVPPGHQRRIRVPAGIAVKVGVAWTAERPRDSLPFGHILDLATIPGTLLFSLQTGPRAADARHMADPALITDLSPTIADLADLAGRIAEMDLVIAVDGLAAHLAAGMGKPVLLLLPRVAHPRWLKGGEESPWYPGMTLLRQADPGQWAPVMAEARDRLEMLAQVTGQRLELARQRATGLGAAVSAFVTAHVRPGDLLVDVGAGNGRFIFEAVEACGGHLLALALEPSPTEADVLKDSLAIAGLEEQVEVLALAAGACEGRTLAAREVRCGARVFSLPEWVPAATPVRPLGAILAERPQLDECRIVARIDQPGWEADILAGLGGRHASVVVIVEHRDGFTAPEMLAEAGYTLWCFPDPVAGGPVVPFDGREGTILALAPGLAPADSYGPVDLPASPSVIAAEARRAESIAAGAPALQAEGKVNQAAHLYADALAVNPFCPMANANLAVLQHMAGKVEASIAGFRRALGDPPNPAIQGNLAAVLRQAQRLDEAEALLLAILDEEGDNPDALHDLAWLRRDQGRLDEAAALMRRVCLITGNQPRHLWALAEILLGAGDFAEGLPLLVHRPTPASRAPRLPLWDGGDVIARSVLVEVGGDLSDAILLARYIPLLAARGCLVSATCPDEMVSLLAELPGIEEVAGEDDPVPECDLRVPLTALPGLLGLADTARPSGSGGYLIAGRGRRVTRDLRLRIGITWNGHGSGGICPLGDLIMLGADPAFTLTALVDEADLPQIEAEGADTLMESPLPQPADLAEMATLIAGMDVVVGGDTEQLHLAAALGKPVLALLPNSFNWRWPAGREDSPWYGSVRVFRPDTEGKWHAALRRVQTALAIMAEHKARL